MGFDYENYHGKDNVIKKVFNQFLYFVRLKDLFLSLPQEKE